MSNIASRTMMGISFIFLEPELPELKETDAYELSELEPLSMVIARP